MFLGPMSIDPKRDGGDFLVARSPFAPSYQLAVVVDDEANGVNQVIRGADLVPSTPRQILLDRALGGSGREFGHIPLVIDHDGRRLAKRDGSIKLATLREQGVDPRRLIGWLARSCGWSEKVEPSMAADWVGRFDLAAIPAEPCVLDLTAWLP
jgi:glutamyl-tRNA synthetase